MEYRRLWGWLAFVVAASFAVLGYFGHEIYVSAPPLPAAVVTSSGQIVFSGQQVQDARTCGSRLVDRSLEPFGDTEHT
jgi:nitric oxide reductase subunit B